MNKMLMSTKILIITGLVAFLSMILSIVAINQQITIPFPMGGISFSVKEIHKSLSGDGGNAFFKSVSLEATIAYVGSIIVMITSGLILAGIAGIFVFHSHIEEGIITKISYCLSVLVIIILIASIIALVDAKHITDLNWLGNHVTIPPVN